MFSVHDLRLKIALFGTFAFFATYLIIYIIARRIIQPIQTATRALKDIAHGEGDLTVCLPLVGNDEVTELSEYFNQTIAKIGNAIKSVGSSAFDMTNIGTDLAHSMSKTAGAVQGITTNINEVKQRAVTQAASVSETAATVEEIMKTIKQLMPENQEKALLLSLMKLEN